MIQSLDGLVFDAVVSLGPNCLAAYRIAKAGVFRVSGLGDGV